MKCGGGNAVEVEIEDTRSISALIEVIKNKLKPRLEAVPIDHIILKYNDEILDTTKDVREVFSSNDTKVIVMVETITPYHVSSSSTTGKKYFHTIIICTFTILL